MFLDLKPILLIRVSYNCLSFQNDNAKHKPEEAEKIQDPFHLVIREPAALGHVQDFPSDWYEKKHDITIGSTSVKETRKKIKFRSSTRR